MMRSIVYSIQIAIFIIACSSTSANIFTKRNAVSIKALKKNKYSSSFSPEVEELIVNIRGGASKTKRKSRKSKSASLHSSSSSSIKKSATGKRAVGSSEKESAISSTLNKYHAILPLTRLYITLIGIVSLISLVLGDEATQGLLALDPIRTFSGLELWRPLTAASFLGPPSIGWLMNAYYLFEYGSSLEKAFGTAQHVLFLFVQISLLTVLSALLGQPFFGSSMITAMLHVLSRSMPKQKVKWLIFTVPYWSLPYGLMASDVLQGQNIVAAVPHIMGILTGHFYYFHKFVWPKLGGEDWLSPPDLLVRRFDPDAKKERVNAALKSKRKKMKGRRLGS